MRDFLKILPFIPWLFSLSCSTLENLSKENSTKNENTTQEYSEKTNFQELELKQTKIWSRMDELESMILQQKERIKILEQGLMLGMIPESLNKENGHKENANKDIDQALSEMKDTPDSVMDESDYKMKLEEAKTLFKEGRFGKSYMILSQLEKQSPNHEWHELTSLWIGRCWFKLGEYQTAKQSFEKLISSKNKEIAPQAQLYLARTELQLGLRTQATKRLQEVLRDYSDNNAAKEAKLILSKMEEKL